MTKIFNYFEQAFDELIHKVSWPTWSELQQSTLITLVGIIILTLLMLAMDSASQLVFESFYGFFK
jgi:preprotein translocase subunit SecE